MSGDAAVARVGEITDAIRTLEHAGTPMTEDLYAELAILADDFGFCPITHLRYAGSPHGSPDGRHPFFDGMRCPYCGADDLDRYLYAVDPDTCPLEPACNEPAPDDGGGPSRWCQLRPNHHEDHERSGEVPVYDSSGRRTSSVPFRLTWPRTSERMT